MEAIECARAEAWEPAETLSSRWDDLPVAERPEACDDVATKRGWRDANALPWARADRIDGGGRLWVPVDSVSLDLTRAGEPGIERSSNGQGASLDIEAATLKALCELVERDAFAAFVAQPVMTRSRAAIDATSVPIAWFRDLRERLDEAGLLLRLWRLPTVIDLSCYAAEIFDLRDHGTARAGAAGTAAHPCAETALKAAVSEAAQARLTEIAGARDDIDAARAAHRGGHIGLGLPLPGARAFETPRAPHTIHRSVASICDALTAAGYARTSRIMLSPPGAAVTVVKTFCHGLGALDRARRETAR